MCVVLVTHADARLADHTENSIGKTVAHRKSWMKWGENAGWNEGAGAEMLKRKSNEGEKMVYGLEGEEEGKSESGMSKDRHGSGMQMQKKISSA